MDVSSQFLGKELLDCTDRIGVWVRPKAVWTCWRSEKPLEMPVKLPEHSVIHYAEYAGCNMKIMYINSALMGRAVT
jgi:hypothetical protein